MSLTPAFISIPGGPEWLIILIVGLLIFGRRLPDVARSVGKSIVEFKRGLKDVKGEIDAADSTPPLEHRKLPPERPAEPPKAPPDQGRPASTEPGASTSEL